MTTLEILGCNATAPGPTGAASGYLLGHESGSVLVDAGPGTLLEFTRRYELDELAAIVVTHLHADHSLDLMAWAYRWTFPELRSTIPLLVPDEELGRIGRFDDLFGIPTLPTMVAPISSAFDVRGLDLDVGASIEVADWRLTPRRALHAVPSATLRFERHGLIVAFSSDTGPCESVVENAAGADLFVCESTQLEADDDFIYGHGHLTPSLAAEIAADAGVKRLLLTHFARPEEAAEMKDVAARIFPGRVDIAQAGDVIDLEPRQRD
ncbi:MAG: MBL fold metallo-hydrolase [Propionibacteriaceae bacterium]|nr:MBL fold metallo-hydrolase [Propionibacteriaceae bacterium]